MEILEILLKLFLAISLGGLIGLEREVSQKPAGFRTNILICVGSAMMMILSQIMLGGREGGTGDILRIAAGVITGIGFIGAGTIIQARGMTVHGLTTAATLWVVAGLGLVIGAGYYLIAVIYTILVVLTLMSVRKIEHVLHKSTAYRYQLTMKDGPGVLIDLKKLAIHHGIRLEGLSFKKDPKVSMISFSLAATEEKEQEFSQSLLELGEIVEIKID